MLRPLRFSRLVTRKSWMDLKFLNPRFVGEAELLNRTFWWFLFLPFELLWPQDWMHLFPKVSEKMSLFEDAAGQVETSASLIGSIRVVLLRDYKKSFVSCETSPQSIGGNCKSFVNSVSIVAWKLKNLNLTTKLSKKRGKKMWQQQLETRCGRQQRKCW